MKSEWKKVKLSDIAVIKKGQNVTKNTSTPGRYPVILGGKEPAYYINKYNHTGKAIVVSRSGASAGYISFWNEPIFVTDGFLVEPKEEFSHELVYYLLKDKQYDFTHSQSGAAIPHVTPAILDGVDLFLPPTECRNNIAVILSRYDSLIENCRKQIKLLEEAAQRLYREWFVDLRFPGHENTAIIDGVPEGWEKKKISDVCELSAGKDKPSIVENTITETCKVPVYSNGITDEGLFGYTDVPRIVCESVTISARGTIGYACLRMHPYVPIVRLLVLIPKAFVSAKFIYQWTLCKEFRGNGAAQQQLTVPLFRDEEILLPTKSLMKSFGEKEDIIFESIDNIKSHLRLLTEARDRLLPKLMSGEITV